jgi:tetratricopeptide (TPR) repeat protein
VSLNSDTTRSLTPPPSEPDTASYDGSLDPALAAAFGPGSTPGRWSQPPLLRDNAAEHEPAVQPSTMDTPSKAGRYDLLGEIARGGMGVILKGHDPDLGRDLAVKVLKQDMAGKPSAEQRFQEEAQVCGQLQHPGIVPVHELGRMADGRPFFAMKLVKGQTFAARLAERPSPAADRAEFLQTYFQVCRTIAYAHSKGVIHRDLKPANIMVGNFGEVQVMDWGLAKVLPQGGLAVNDLASRERTRPDFAEPTVIQTARTGTASAETAAGSVLGTPAYMAPEQAGGEVERVDERADVFGLGALLCVILTGEPPYLGDSSEAVRLLAVRGNVDDAFTRLDQCGADAELVELCKRCLAPDPTDRPRHGTEVADAVQHYLAGVEERAHQAEVERAKAEAQAAEERKRRKVQRRLAGAVLLTLVIGAAAATWFVTDRFARSAELDRSWGETERLVPLTGNGSPTQRLATTQAALTAARTAQAQFGFAVGGSNLQDQVRALITRLEEQERDLQLLCDLEAAWLREAEVTAEKRTFDRPLAAPAYADAFRKAGLDVLGGEPKEAAEAVRGRSFLRVELVAALDAWAEIEPDGKIGKRLREVARLAHADSPRARLAELIDKKDARGIGAFVNAQNGRSLQPTVAVDLARQLRKKGYTNHAVALLREVHDYQPNDFWVNFELARTYITTDPPRSEEVVRFLTAALAVRPDVPVAYTFLGHALMARGRNAEALAAYRRAVNLNSQCFQARKALIQHAEPAERAKYIAELEQLARDLPEDAGVQRDLGLMYLRQGQFDRAAEQLHKTTALAPHRWDVWANFGLSLDEVGRTEEAIPALREAHRLAPGRDDVRTHFLRLLTRTGAAAEELQVFKTWYDRLPANDPQRTHWAPQVKYLERQAAVERRLVDFRDGRAEPASGAEAAIAARLCQGKKLYPDAVRFFVQAFEREPKLADLPQSVDRYNAACAAARAAAEPGPGDAQAKYRKQALDWLRADLAARSSRAKTEKERADLRKFLRETVRPDADLAALRSWSLARLPADERGEWVKFWAEVAAAEKAMGTPAASPPQEAKR